ncbi:unnamed protein product [Lota lota]
MHCIPETPPTPRPCKGPLGHPLDSGSTQTSSEVETAAGSTPVSATPWQVVVPGPSLKEVIVQLLTQVSPGYPPPGTPEKISIIFQETQRLLASSFPWVRVTEDRQQANCLLQPTTPCQAAESILAHLEQVLLPRDRLAGALVTAPHVLNHYMCYLVAVSVAQLVPHQLQATQEDMQKVVWAVRCLPPGSMLTVSSDLVDDLLVQLILKLHPLDGDGYRQLDQQKLLALTLQLSALTLETLRKMPGVTVDTALPRPSWDLRRLTFQVQSRLMKAFGTFYQKLNVALPNTWLTREGLMQDPQVALLACSLVAKEVLNHIKPSVSFSEEVQGGDNAPYSINVPVRKQEEGDKERPLTLLEERLHKERKVSREEFLTCPEKEPELKEVKTKNKCFSWLRRLFSRKKN